MDLGYVALLMGAGLTAGAANGIAGGGSLITFPALLATGLPPIAANVTNSIGVFPGNAATVAGSFADLRTLASEIGLVRMWLMVPTVIAGTAAGCALLLAAPAKAFDLVVPFLVLGAAAVLAFRDRLRAVIGHPATMSRRRSIVAQHGVVSLATVYGGYFGAAMGVILISSLAVVVDSTLAKVSALKNAVSTLCGLVTVVVFALFGPVHWTAVALVASTNIVGGYLGARLARVIPANVLRGIIVVYATAIGLYLLGKTVAG